METFDLRRLIRFNTRVVNLQPLCSAAAKHPDSGNAGSENGIVQNGECESRECPVQSWLLTSQPVGSRI